MIEWILANKTLAVILLDVFLTFLYVIISLFKNKNKVSESLSYVLEVVPEFIKIAEAVFGSGYGDEKLTFVLDLVKAFKKKVGYKGTFNFQDYIEKVLETPQKKEVFDEEIKS